MVRDASGNAHLKLAREGLGECSYRTRSDNVHRDQTGVMRPGPNKRSRGRNNGNNPHHNRPRMPHRIQTFDSNGPNIKIRGNAYQVFERYVSLAREAAASGDRIAAENLYQHAEHYFRVMNANGEANSHGGGPSRPTTPADLELSGGERERPETEQNLVQTPPPPVPDDQPPGF